MKFKIQVIAVTDAGEERADESTCLERESTQLQLETLGLTLEEGKAILKDLQAIMVEQQTAEYLAQTRCCPDCSKPRRSKGNHSITFRTVFGNLPLKSPRLYHCDCQPHEGKTFSPLAQLLAERTAPELLFLETKWASLVSYGLTVKLLQEVLPIDEKLNPETVRQHLQRAAERNEQALGEEQFMFIEGCQHDWDHLPLPDGPLIVGIDGGFVKARKKQGWFEVIAGKSVLSFKRDDVASEPSAKCFGFVQTLDPKPKRRLFELLQAQGMQMNQQVIFLSDGGETVRNLQLYLNPNAEHLLDWFHVTMRLTVMNQMAKGLKTINPKLHADALKELERIKWYLWHGNVYRALQSIEDFDILLDDDDPNPVKSKLLKALKEFQTYIESNANFIPNYGERYRNGETISTAFVVSTVNQVISKRLVKKQSMQWTPRGAHLLLQTRTRVLNDELESTFRQWYPHFRLNSSEDARLVA